MFRRKLCMIYDCFTFFNELDLLEIRLNLLNSIVDYFVLVEGTKTFTNKDKRLEYEINKERFKPFRHKIIHIIVDSYPEYTGNPWEYEFFQRNSIMRGLINCKKNDFVIISDVDEIPAPDVILKCTDPQNIYFFTQNSYNVYLNMQYENEKHWDGTVMLSFSRITTPEHIRTCRLYYKKNQYISIIKKYFYFLTLNIYRYKKWSNICKHQLKRSIEIDNGGWHFSYCGGTQIIVEKLQSYSHQEYNTEKNRNPEYITEQIENRTFCFHNANAKLVSVPIDTSFPSYLRENLEKFQNLIIKPD